MTEIQESKAGQFAINVLGYSDGFVKSFNNQSNLIYHIKKDPAFDEDQYRSFQKVKKGAKKSGSRGKVAKRSVPSSVAKASGTETPDAERSFSDPNVIFDDIEKLSKVVASGAQNALIIAGDPGVGKTYHVEKSLKETLGEPGGKHGKWVQYKGANITALGLYKILFEHREGMTIVLDDADSVWRDENAVNMLKAALDTSDSRQIRWASKATMSVDKMDKREREEIYEDVDRALIEQPEEVGGKIKLPNMFDFNSQIVFVTNLQPKKLDAAVRSRALFMDVHLSDEAMMNRIREVIQHKYTDMSKREKDSVINRISESNKKVTMRSVEAALAIKSAGIEDWERMVASYV